MLRIRILGLIGVMLVVSLRLVTPIIAQNETDNCTLSIGGQGFYISGGAGEVTTTPTVSAPNNVSDVAGEITQLVLADQNVPVGSLMGNQPTAIIVADDFQQFSKPGVIEDLRQATSDTQIQSLLVPHGDLVREHLRALINATKQYSHLSRGTVATAYTDPGGQAFDFEWEDAVPTSSSSGSANLELIALDTADYDTGVIASRITGLKDALEKKNPPIKRVVVNMSFSVLPCDLVKEYVNFDATPATPKPPTFWEFARQRYQSIFGPNNSFKDWYAWVQKQLINIDNDPLRKVILSKYHAEIKVSLSTIRLSDLIFVASAGNAGKEYPFALYPGAWAEVVNVGASNAVMPSTALNLPTDNMPDWMADYSNPGEVLAYGGFYQLENSNVFYDGTSFAAPVVSLYDALMLSHDPINCLAFNHSIPSMADLPSYDMLDVVMKTDCDPSAPNISLTAAQTIPAPTNLTVLPLPAQNLHLNWDDGSSESADGLLWAFGEADWSPTPSIPIPIPSAWAFTRIQPEIYFYDAGAGQKTLRWTNLTAIDSPPEIDGDTIIVVEKGTFNGSSALH